MSQIITPSWNQDGQPIEDIIFNNLHEQAQIQILAVTKKALSLLNPENSQFDPDFY